MNRLTHTLTLFPNSPSIMACPDKVPVTDEAIQKKEELRQNIGKK
jgi:hypothetical protein